MVYHKVSKNKNLKQKSSNIDKYTILFRNNQKTNLFKKFKEQI